MPFKQIFCLVSVVSVVSVFAQQGFENVEDVMDELMNFEEEAPVETETEPAQTIEKEETPVSSNSEQATERAPEPNEPAPASRPSAASETTSVFDKHPADMTDEELVLLAKTMNMKTMRTRRTVIHRNGMQQN